MESLDLSTIDPASIDLDALIAGASPITIPIKVYFDGALYGRFLAKSAELEAAYRAEGNGPKDLRVGQARVSKAIEDEAVALYEALQSKAVTLFVAGLPSRRRKELRTETERIAAERGIPLPPKTIPDGDDTDYSAFANLGDAVVLSHAVTVGENGPNLTLAQAEALPDAIGDAQYLEVMAAYGTALQTAPQVVAPLSRRSSDGSAGRTS